MDSIGILLTQTVTPTELEILCNELGGRWQDWPADPKLTQAAFESSDTFAFLRGVARQCDALAMVPKDEILAASAQLGAPIVAVLTVDFHKGEAGEILARKIADHLVSRFGGVVQTWF